jgi:predicted ATPase
MLQEELARASRDARARGMSPDELVAQLDERIARLRAQIAELPAEDS